MNNRIFNIVMNGCLVIALVAVLAPQAIPHAQPWSGYIALAAGIIALCTFLIAEFRDLPSEGKTLDDANNIFGKTLATRWVAADHHLLPSLLSSWKTTKIETLDNVFNRKYDNPKLPETERLQRLRHDYLSEPKDEHLIITIGEVKVEIAEDGLKVFIVPMKKAATRSVRDVVAEAPAALASDLPSIKPNYH
jgi:hypothetical protein